MWMHSAHASYIFINMRSDQNIVVLIRTQCQRWFCFCFFSYIHSSFISSIPRNSYRLFVHHSIRWLIDQQKEIYSGSFFSSSRDLFGWFIGQFLLVLNPSTTDSCLKPSSICSTAQIHVRHFQAIWRFSRFHEKYYIFIYYLWLLFHTLMRLTNAIIIISCVSLNRCVPSARTHFGGHWYNQTAFIPNMNLSCGNKSRNIHLCITFLSSFTAVDSNLIKSLDEKWEKKGFSATFFVHFFLHRFISFLSWYLKLLGVLLILVFFSRRRHRRFTNF